MVKRQHPQTTPIPTKTTMDLGKTQLGKTQLIENLKKNGVTTYSIDYGSKFYDGMHDGIQLISFDEFKAQKQSPK